MGEFKIGWARRDVSTDKPINIPGQFHMRISRGILDPNFVTALVVEDGNDLVCFLSMDLVVIEVDCWTISARRSPSSCRNPRDQDHRQCDAYPSAQHHNDKHSLPSGDIADSEDKLPIEVADPRNTGRFVVERGGCDRRGVSWSCRRGIVWGYGYALLGTAVA